ncbi:hypothetical protein IJ425_09455 [bacterium]|nr:hypothetical protein [bacterium]
MDCYVNINDAVERHSILINDILLSSKTGKEILVSGGQPIKEVFLFQVTIRCIIDPTLHNKYVEMNVNNIVKALFVLYGEQCLDKDFFLEQCEKHFPAMKIKDIDIIELQKFYKKTTNFRGKETVYSSNIFLHSCKTSNV